MTSATKNSNPPLTKLKILFLEGYNSIDGYLPIYSNLLLALTGSVPIKTNANVYDHNLSLPQAIGDLKINNYCKLMSCTPLPIRVVDF